MDLFRSGSFLLHSGELSDFKVECEAFSAGDWNSLAEIIDLRLPRFGVVVGVPRGGLPLQRALEPFATGCLSDPLLIVDDVYTRGTSIREERQRQEERWVGTIMGLVIFARYPISDQDDWVKALWTKTLDEDSFSWVHGS